MITKGAVVGDRLRPSLRTAPTWRRWFASARSIIGRVEHLALEEHHGCRNASTAGWLFAGHGVVTMGRIGLLCARGARSTLPDALSSEESCAARKRTRDAAVGAARAMIVADVVRGVPCPWGLEGHSRR